MVAASYVDMRVLRVEQYALAARIAAADMESTLGRAVSSGVAPLNVWTTGTLIDTGAVHRSLRAISMETLIGSTLVCRAHFELLVVVELGVSLVGLGCARPNV